MTTAQVFETSVTVTNSYFQNYTHVDDHIRQSTDSPGFKFVSIFFLDRTCLQAKYYKRYGI